MTKHPTFSRASLGITLSKLNVFVDVEHKLEQHPTPSQLAANFLWDAQTDLTGKKVLDLGCGTGILTLGAALLGANITGVDISIDALELAQKNCSLLEQYFSFNSPIFVHNDIGDLAVKSYDAVIMNPPFGTKHKGVDLLFLEKGMQCAPVVWSMHKTATVDFVVKFAHKHGFVLSKRQDVLFPLKATHEKHTRKSYDVEVSLLRFVKQ